MSSTVFVERICGGILSAMGKKIHLFVDMSELGAKGGKSTAQARTPEERKAASAKAIAARWEKYYRDHPEKLKAKQERERLLSKSRTRSSRSR